MKVKVSNIFFTIFFFHKSNKNNNVTFTGSYPLMIIIRYTPLLFRFRYFKIKLLLFSNNTISLTSAAYKQCRENFKTTMQIQKQVKGVIKKTMNLSSGIKFFFIFYILPRTCILYLYVNIMSSLLNDHVANMATFVIYSKMVLSPLPKINFNLSSKLLAKR